MDGVAAPGMAHAARAPPPRTSHKHNHHVASDREAERAQVPAKDELQQQHLCTDRLAALLPEDLIDDCRSLCWHYTWRAAHDHLARAQPGNRARARARYAITPRSRCAALCATADPRPARNVDIPPDKLEVEDGGAVSCTT